MQYEGVLEISSLAKESGLSRTAVIAYIEAMLIPEKILIPGLFLSTFLLRQAAKPLSNIS